MSVSKKVWLAACLSCLQHDVRTAKNCLQFHVLNPYNPFSKLAREELRPLVDALELAYRAFDDPEFQQKVFDSLK